MYFPLPAQRLHATVISPVPPQRRQLTVRSAWNTPLPLQRPQVLVPGLPRPSQRKQVLAFRHLAPTVSLQTTQSGGSRYESGRSIPDPVQVLLNLAFATDAKAAALFEELRTLGRARKRAKADSGSKKG